MCRVPGHEAVVGLPDLTAAAGPVLAVHRRRFLEVGGYDPIYFPGRIEDLDLGFRGWMAGYRGYYVPESVAYHRGFGTFEAELGLARSDRIAQRNSLIFMWKNTAGARLLAHLGWLPVRLGAALVRGRLDFATAMVEAVGRLGRVLEARRALAVGGPGWIERQEAFYQRFRW
jgi:GT2 family glycosyltransferase